MDKKLDQMNVKLDKIDERLDKVEQVLVRNTAVMEEHHRRSNAIEAHVSKLESRFYQELGPIKKHVDMISYGVKGIGWAFAVIAAIAGLVLTATQLGIF